MIVGFEQDTHPDAPPGAGYAVADSGERAYVYDPNLAAQFSSQAPQQQPEQPPSYDLMSAADAGLDEGSDQRLALGTGGGRQGYQQGPPAPPPSVADVGPNMSPAPPSGPNMSQAPPPAPNASVAGPQSSQAAAPPPQGQPPEVDPDEQLRAQLQAGINAPVYQAPVKGGLRPKSAEVTSEGAEAPMEAADWRELQDANEAIAQTQVAKAGVLRAQAEQQVMQAQSQLPRLQQEFEANKAIYEQARGAAKQDLARVNGLLQEVNAKRIDHGRFFQRTGAFGALAAGIAQGLGASAAMLSGTGHNIVADQINKMIDADVAEQREDIENGRANANNALQLIRERYNFDIPQAESALKIAQLGVVNAQLREYEGMKMSQEAWMGLEEWAAKNQKEMFLEARKLYTASMGKQTRKESLTYQQGSAGGWRKPTDVEIGRRLDNTKKAQDVGAIDKPGGGDNKIDPATVIYGVDGKPVQATSPAAADKVRDQYKLYKQAKPSLIALQDLAGIGKSFSWDDSSAYAVHLENVINTANTLAGQGVVRTDDIARYKQSIAQGGLGAKRALAELSKIIDNSYQSSVDAQTGPSVSVDFSRGKPKATYNKKRATTPTVGRSQGGTDVTTDDLKSYLKSNYGGE